MDIEEIRKISSETDRLYLELNATLNEMDRFLQKHCPHVETWVSLQGFATAGRGTLALGFTKYKAQGGETVWGLVVRYPAERQEVQKHVSLAGAEERILVARHFENLVDQIRKVATEHKSELSYAVEAGQRALRKAQAELEPGCTPPPGWKGRG